MNCQTNKMNCQHCQKKLSDVYYTDYVSMCHVNEVGQNVDKELYCESYLCMDCLIKLIEINKGTMVSYTCPCGRDIIKNINGDFSNTCNPENVILGQISTLLEGTLFEKHKIHLSEAGSLFQESATKKRKIK